MTNISRKKGRKNEFSLKDNHNKNSLVIKQKGKSQNGCDKKTKHAKISENQHFLLPDTHTHVYVSGGKKFSFFGKFRELYFLLTSALRLSFYLIPHELQEEELTGFNPI